MRQEAELARLHRERDELEAQAQEAQAVSVEVDTSIANAFRPPPPVEAPPPPVYPTPMLLCNEQKFSAQLHEVKDWFSALGDAII